MENRVVKVVEKPLDRLDPMFSEAPTRYAPKKAQRQVRQSDGQNSYSMKSSDNEAIKNPNPNISAAQNFV